MTHCSDLEQAARYADSILLNMKRIGRALRFFVSMMRDNSKRVFVGFRRTGEL